MKPITYILICALFLASCTSKKIIIDGTAVKSLSAKKVAEKHFNANFTKKTVDAKLRVAFKNEKQDVAFSVRMKIKKDEVIWLKGTKLISLFKAKITPTSVRYYSPLQKQYFDGDFSMLQKLLGTEINFQQLQNILLGQSLLNIKEEKHTLNIVDNSYQLSPKIQQDLFDIFFQISPKHFKLNKQFLVNSAKKQQLEIVYPKYLEKNGTIFPEQFIINAKDNTKITRINVTVRSVAFDKQLNLLYNVPKGYKEVKL